jgi:hypothetical protein
MADFNCIKCGSPNRVHNPDGTEIIELLPIDKEATVKDYLIAVCPVCATSNIAVLKEKIKRSKTELKLDAQDSTTNHN